MALKAVVANLNDIPQEFQSLYSQVGDTYVLDLDDKDFKDKLSEFRNNNIDLVKQNEGLKTEAEKAAELQDMLKNFEGIDPEAAKEAMEKMQAMDDKKLIDAGNIEELVNKRADQRTERMRNDYETQIKALQKSVDDLTGARDSYKTQLSSHVIDNSLQSAVSKVAQVRQGALDDILSRGRNIWSLNDDGRAEARENSELKFGKNGKDPMTMEEWAQDLVLTAPHLFEGNSGGGAGGGSGGGGEGGTISASDQDALNANIEGIAAGKVTVASD